MFEILLVEDNTGDVRLTTEAFSEINAKVHIHHVGDGAKALEYLREMKDKTLPDLILLDLNLPKIDGREVLKQVKSNDKIKHVPLLILTTSQASTDIQQCYQLGANAYINKPVDFNEFLATIRVIDEFWIRRAKMPSSRG